MMEGEDEESRTTALFHHKPLLQRIAIVAAGPLFNFILAYVLSVFLIGAMGYDVPTLAIDGRGLPQRGRKGLAAGDTIIALNHYRVHFLSGNRCLFFLSSG